MVMTKILGLDISSTTVGWGLLELNDSGKIKYLDSGYIKPSKKGEIFEKLFDLQIKIKDLLMKTDPDSIAIEEISKFFPKKSTAQTIITLAVYNRMIGLECFHYLMKSPELCNVMSIRHKLKLTKDLPKKEEMMEICEHHLNFTFPRQYNKKGEIKTECYDETDGICVALYQAILSRSPTK